MNKEAADLAAAALPPVCPGHRRVSVHLTIEPDDPSGRCRYSWSEVPTVGAPLARSPEVLRWREAAMRPRTLKVGGRACRALVTALRVTGVAVEGSAELRWRDE